MAAPADRLPVWIPLLVAGATFAVLAGFAGWIGLESTAPPQYFASLAWSMQHGRLDLPDWPATAHDLSPFEGHVYAYWPPLTALLMLPFVGFTGAEAFPQRLFALIFGGLNAALATMLIHRLVCAARQTRPIRVAVVGGLTFGLGTSNAIFAVVASHWYVAQLTATTPFLLGLWLALERRPSCRPQAILWSGIWLAVATLGRQHLVLAAPLWVFLALSDETYRLPGVGGWIRRLLDPLRSANGWRRVAMIGAPLVVAMGLIAVYNAARFGSPLENGIRFHNMNPRFQADFLHHGYFSPIYLPRNVYFTLLRYPYFEYADGYDRAMGFSLFLQSPILLLAVAMKVEPRWRDLASGVWWSVGLVSLPILMLMGTGWVQFGARYLFDLVPMLVLLVVLKRPQVHPSWALGLGLLSILINLYGSQRLFDIRF